MCRPYGSEMRHLHTEGVVHMYCVLCALFNQENVLCMAGLFSYDGA